MNILIYAQLSLDSGRTTLTVVNSEKGNGACTIEQEGQPDQVFTFSNKGQKKNVNLIRTEGSLVRNTGATKLDVQ